MQAFKGAEDFFQVGRFDADSMVPYGEMPDAAALSCRDVDARRLAWPGVFQPVADEVFEQQHQRYLFRSNDGQQIMGYHRGAFLDSNLKIRDRFLKNLIAIDDNIFLNLSLVDRPIVSQPL